MLLIDFVFQSGEFYGDSGGFWEDLLIELTGAIIGAGIGAGIGAYITYRVFRETLRRDSEREERQREVEKEREERQRKIEKEKEEEARIKLENERLVYLHYLIRGSIIFTEGFISYLNQFYRDFEKNNNQLPPLYRRPFNDLQRLIDKVDREQHFHAYRNRVNGEEILKSVF